MLTSQQADMEVYRFIRRYILRHGYAPTEQEIVNDSSFCESRQKVRNTIARLVTENFLTQAAGKRRNLQLVQHQNPLKELPVIGHIAAGRPLEPLDSEQFLNLSDILLGANRYVLQVSGDSMTGDNICNGDYVLCEHRNNPGATEGAIVVAKIREQGITLKRLKHNQDGTITLISSNPEAKPMSFKSTDVEIHGICLGIIRLIDATNLKCERKKE